MLKVDSIIFTDAKKQSYTINNNQIEHFPLIGGEEANMVATQVWNQHGTTPINAFMNAYEGELLFALFVSNRNPDEILAQRRALINICNPLNGNLTMTVNLNNGATYQRDITFTSAPNFPIGLENRNPIWQKVQLLYIANNPFWYSETEIIESFQAVEPLFHFPFTMSPSNPVIFGNIIPNKIAINEGQVEAPVIIEINGACVNPVITNQTTGEFIRFKNLTMTANDKLVINTTFGRKKVELNETNVFNKLDFASTFFNLQIGENTIDFSDDSGISNAAIHFIYKNLYITI